MTHQPHYILTEEEYQDLLKIKSEPDQILRETNQQLKAKLDTCTKQLEQGTYENARIDSPFYIKDDKLYIRSETDFMIMYNSLAGKSLTDSDTSFCMQMQTIATLFNLEPQFTTSSDVKRYRTQAQKQYKRTMADGSVVFTRI